MTLQAPDFTQFQLDRYSRQIRQDGFGIEGQRRLRDAHAEEHDLTGHVVIAVLIDGKVRFKGFPTGRAPMKAAEGDWRIEDFDTALRERTRREAP